MIDPGRPRALASSGYAERRAELARAFAQAGVVVQAADGARVLSS